MITEESKESSQISQAAKPIVEVKKEKVPEVEQTSLHEEDPKNIQPVMESQMSQK